MAKHMVKCFYCGKSFDANEEPFVKPRANRYAHQSCADVAEKNKTQEEKDKEMLEKYIKDLFGINCISVKISKQIKDFHENKKYSYSGMYKSLKYFYEIKGGSIERANGGIGIIPWIWDEAFRYFQAIWEAQQRNEKIDIQQYIFPVREIHIRPPERQPMKHIRKLFTFLDEEEEVE